MKPSIRILASALICVAAIGCSKKEVKEDPNASGVNGTDTSTSSGIDGSDGTSPRPGAYTAADLERDSCLRQRVVYFDLDSDRVRSDFNAVVNCHAQYVRDVPGAMLTLEGHADERGTREYNLGLAERRAGAVQSLMTSQGAKQSQLNLTSYGEERPVCDESSESCWSKNRRVELRYNGR